MRVGEAFAAEIRHRVGLAPHHVVQDPEIEVLQRRADPEDVVVGADHPQGRGLLHHAAAGGKPGAGEGVVIGKARELVPVVIDGVDAAVVGARQRALELQVVGRIGEDKVDAVRRQPFERRDAIGDDHLVERQQAGRKPHPSRRRGPSGTRDLNPEGGAGGPGTLGSHGGTP